MVGLQLWIRARPCLFYQSSPFIVHPPLFSPVPACCLLPPSTYYHLGYPCPTSNSKECVCVCVTACVVFVFVGACIVLRILMLVTFCNFLGVIMCTNTWAGFLTNSWSLCERFRCVGVCVSKVVCVQRRLWVCVQALDTHHCTTLWAWRHLTLNNRCGCSEYLMGGGCRCMRRFAHIHTHMWKRKYNIHACKTFRLKLLGKWSLYGRVMLSVKDTVEVRQSATLAFTPSSLLSLSYNRALRIVLAVRRDSYHHLSPHSLHLPHRHPRTAWPWITGAACTQRVPSRALWKPVE